MIQNINFKNKNSQYLHFPSVFVCDTGATLRIDFVTYSPIHFSNDANDIPLRRNRDLQQLIEQYQKINKYQQ